MVSGTHLAFGNNCPNENWKAQLVFTQNHGSDFGIYGVDLEEICEVGGAQLG